jgi:AmmeMemoRadiSam system protein B
VSIDDRAHADEHALEVHLPFLQRTLGDGWSLVPIVVGDARPAEVADVLDACWGGPETLIVVSSDLSHYHEQHAANALDRATAELILERRAGELRPDRACGARAVAGLLEAARRHDLGVELLDLRTSGDTAGPPDRVVGYGAFALGAEPPGEATNVGAGLSRQAKPRTTKTSSATGSLRTEMHS